MTSSSNMHKYSKESTVIISKFKNDSIYPVIIESFKLLPNNPHISKIFEVRVLPQQEIILEGDLDEWKIHNYFSKNDKEAYTIWKEYYDKKSKMKLCRFSNTYLGKFRTLPCASGDYSWMDDDNFNAKFTNETLDENITIITPFLI